MLAALLLILLPLGQLFRVPVFETGAKEAPLLIIDIVVAIAFGLMIAAAVRNGRFRVDLALGAVALFVIMNVAGVLWTTIRLGLEPGDTLVSLLYLARWTVYAGLYGFALTHLRARATGALSNVFLIACAIFAAFGAVQSVFLPNFAFIVYPDAISAVDWDRQGHRLVSTFLDPNFAGGFILMGLLLLHARGAVGARAPQLLIAGLWLTLLLTFSRSSVLAALVGVSWLTIKTRGRGAGIVPVLLAGVVVAVTAQYWISFATDYQKLTLSDPSALSRIGLWLLAARTFVDHPIVGVGYNTFGFVRAEYGEAVFGGASFAVEGGLLYLAAVSGLVGLALIAYLLWRIFRTGLDVYRRTSLQPEQRGLGLALSAWIPALLVHSLAANSIFYPFILAPFFLFAGLCAACLYQRPNPLGAQ